MNQGEQPARAQREPTSPFRAFQVSPLLRLASDGNDHAHVRTAAILGYN